MKNNTFYPISQLEIESILFPMGFKQISVNGCDEIVYGKIVGRNVCLRVYSSITHSGVRGCGKDALRIALFGKDRNGNIALISGTKRINRIQTWEKNLKKRINNLKIPKISYCHKCGSIMSVRKGENGGFLGCSQYPKCKSTQRYEKYN